MSTSFTKKKITVTFVLGTGQFGNGKGNAKVIEGLRVECQIEKNGHPAKNKAKLKIYGMLQEDMNTLTTPPKKVLAVRKNLVQVRAGDGTGMSLVFEGEMTGAWAKYHSPPNLYFQVEALAGFFPAIHPATPKSYQGSASVTAILATLALEMQYIFENNGVNTQLSNPYLAGTAFNQAATVANAANLEFGIDDGVMFVAPRGTPRKGTAPLVSAATGLIGYPEFGKKGIKIRTLWNPGIVLGGSIVVESAVTVANGTWKVNALKTHLEGEKPGGKWESEVSASYVGN